MEVRARSGEDPLSSACNHHKMYILQEDRPSFGADENEGAEEGAEEERERRG